MKLYELSLVDRGRLLHTIYSHLLTVFKFIPDILFSLLCGLRGKALQWTIRKEKKGSNYTLFISLEILLFTHALFATNLISWKTWVYLSIFFIFINSAVQLFSSFFWLYRLSYALNSILKFLLIFLLSLFLFKRYWWYMLFIV